MTTKDELQPATAQALGKAVRKTLKKLGLDFKVTARTVDFGGFGYGRMPLANIQTDRKLSEVECKALADTVRELRATPYSENGGKGIIELAGPSYPFGGDIGHKDHLTDAVEPYLEGDEDE